MIEPQHPDHEHDPPAPPFTVPPFALLWRGAAMLIVAFIAFSAASRIFVRHPLLAAPLYLLLDVVGVLAAWAGIIHVTGGERFDDHPSI